MEAKHHGFFERSALDVARDLIGSTLLFNRVGGIIVETEAYSEDDAASRSFKGPNKRYSSMFGPAGHAYIFRSYGIHWCLNAVCLPGSAVLIRALEPTTGLSLKRARRGVEANRLLCSGRGRLQNSLSLQVGKRIGVSKTMEEPWRLGLGGSEFLSNEL